jgi:hypothetical protein
MEAGCRKALFRFVELMGFFAAIPQIAFVIAKAGQEVALNSKRDQTSRLVDERIEPAEVEG